MPSGQNWLNFLYVNIAFIGYIFAMYYLIALQDIKENWPLYRCNPMYMPLSEKPEEDFTYCVQNMQSSFMGHLLQPLTYITSALTTAMGSFGDKLNMVRAMFHKIRTFLSSIVQNVFGVFLNLVIEFQRITIGIKDLIGKTIGIMTVLLYTLDGSIKTMNSTWNGPPGQMVRALGKCFHPQTLIRLKNGNVVSIKDLSLGDVLEDGSIVEATMKIDNKRDPVNFYTIKNSGIHNQDIYVTGSHLVFDNKTQRFIPVSEYHLAEPCDKTFDWFSCLITSTHRIPIGKETFWDWEDHFMK